MPNPSLFPSPLRYPGGKGKISSFLEDLILINNLDGSVLYELYAGGAGASLSLLFEGVCERIVLNDLDEHIYSFWYCVLNETEALVQRINDSIVDVPNWEKQKVIYSNPKGFSKLDVAFSTFFLNRCNRSGILFRAGPIGGYDQTGNYKIDVRFNKQDLTRRIEKIAQFKNKIQVENLESIEFLQTIFNSNESKKFIFLDPPYYIQGEHLYLSCYEDSNHIALANLLEEHRSENWFLTYDNCDRINELYSNFRRSELEMSYTLQSKRKAKEVMIFSDSLHLPKQLRVGSKSSTLNTIN
jgi:DNA adenine methylase